MSHCTRILVPQFGPPQVMHVVHEPMPQPGPGQVRVRLTSIGMNHADLMGRAGHYKLSTGEPPYTPGLEGGGVIDAIGPDVTDWQTGQRVLLGPHVPRGVQGAHGGTYRSHMIVSTDLLIAAPDAIDDDQLGAIWLTYLTAWGALVWKIGLQPGQFVAIPAASSGVGLAAAQVVRHFDAIPVGLTSSEDKAAAIAEQFDHLVITHDRDDAGQRIMRPWRQQIKQITDGHGIDVFFDPVAAGPYLTEEIRCLAPGGVLCFYGLLGKPDVVDLHPLIARRGRIETFLMSAMVEQGESVWRPACAAILELFQTGVFQQRVARTFALRDVVAAHEFMARDRHIGKLVLVP